uniref:Uncharacterized protein n=1 Tax=Anguilla anguilla TaxID=7936 RepID=A0A0E9TZ53_ANGAN
MIIVSGQIISQSFSSNWAPNKFT